MARGFKGVDQLVALLECRKKRDLERCAKGMTIRLQDLAELIMACDMADIGLRHQMCQREKVPEHLKLTREDLESLSRGPGTADGKAAVRRTSQFFRDRQVLTGHLLHTPDLRRWHFFFITERDYSPDFNHWAHGAHVHFVNYLWPNYTAKGVWTQFRDGNPLDLDSIHIRFEEPNPEPSKRVELTGQAAHWE